VRSKGESFTHPKLLINLSIGKVILGETLPHKWVKHSPFEAKRRVKRSPLPVVSTYSLPVVVGFALWICRKRNEQHGAATRQEDKKESAPSGRSTLFEAR
jgi:hypothetical protein